MQRGKRLRGGQFHYVRDSRGVVIPHLGCTPWGKAKDRVRYYVQRSTPRIWLGFDLVQAISKLERLKLQRGNKSIALDVPLPSDAAISVDEISERFNPVVVESRLTDSYHLTYSIPEDALWERFKEMVAADPFCAEKRLAVKFADPDSIKAALPLGKIYRDEKKQWVIPTGRNVVNFYLDARRQRPLSDMWRKKVYSHWEKFTKAVGVATCDKVTEVEIDRYYHLVEVPTYSYDTRVRAYSAILDVLRFSMTECPEAMRVYLLCKKRLVAVGVSKTDSRPITREELTAMVKVIKKAKDQKFLAAVYLALNGCYYPSELEKLPLKHINLTTGVIATKRPKTGMDRVCTLWPETQTLLSNYLSSEDFNKRDPEKDYSKTIFGWSSGRFGKKWTEYRDQTTVAKDCGFDSLRDAAYTIAGSGTMIGDTLNVDVARVLAGHSIGKGSVDSYFLRNETHVRAACERIKTELIS